jgi:hypothetical protein
MAWHYAAGPMVIALWDTASCSRSVSAKARTMDRRRRAIFEKGGMGDRCFGSSHRAAGKLPGSGDGVPDTAQPVRSLDNTADWYLPCQRHTATRTRMVGERRQSGCR